MEDKDPIRDLFAGFEPAIGSEEEFMKRLDSAMNAVDAVRRVETARRRRSHAALTAAFAVGLVSGVILTLTFGVVEGFVAMLLAPLTAEVGTAFPAATFVTAAAFGLLTLVMAFSAYDMTYALLGRRSE